MTTASESNDVSKTARSGKILAGKYRLLRRLGRGGMGTVYEVEHTGIGRHFAVKFLSKELSEDRDFLKRFDLEAKTGGRLNHENIIAVTDSGLDEDKAPFFVMEYLEGCSLRELLDKSGELDINRAIDIIIQACRGINAAHSQNIIHRDLKPDNLFIAQRGDGSDWVKILDFGIAKLLGGSVSGVHTKTGVAIGTFLYMPQEQLNDASGIDHRADIYALGVILYEMLSMSLPHPGESIQEIISHIVTKKPVSLRAVKPGLPEELIEIVHKAISSNPNDRYHSVKDFMAALAPFSPRIISSIPAPLSDSGKNVPPATNVAVLSRIPDKSSIEDQGVRETEPSLDPSSQRPDIRKSSKSQEKSSETEMEKEVAGLGAKRSRTFYVPIIASFLVVLAIVIWFWISGSEKSETMEPSAQPSETVDTAPIPAIEKESISGPQREDEGNEQTPESLPEGLASPASTVTDERPDDVVESPRGHKSGHAAKAKLSDATTRTKKKERASRQNKSVVQKGQSSVSPEETGEKGTKKLKTFTRKKGQRDLKFIDGNPYE